MSRIPHYSEFMNKIDVDAFEEQIGFEKMYSRGENDIGKCVFPDRHAHGDTTGKFAIHRSKRCFNCFLCEGGSFLSLVMDLYGLEIDEATRFLYQFTKSDIQDDSEFIDQFLSNLEEEKKKIEEIPYFNEKILEKYWKDDAYFEFRGISKKIIEIYKLRYAPKAFKESPNQEPNYRGPAHIFPHFLNKKLVGWQYRWADWDRDHTKTPRYIAKYNNSADFPKTTTLYNYDSALESKIPVIVCESVPTVLLLASFDIPAVAYFGSTIKEDQLKLLRRFQNGVVLAPDNDSNGDKLLSTATPYLQKYIDVWHLPKIKEYGIGGDLGDFTKDFKGNYLKKAIDLFIDLKYKPEAKL